MIVLITSHAYTHHCISLSLTCWSCWLIILVGDSNIASFLMLHWYICMRYLTCWLWDWLSWLRIPMSCFLLCFIDVFVWDIDMPIILITLIVLLSILTLISSWLFWSLHMHTLTTIHHSAWHVVSLTCILFWSSLSMMFVSLFVLIVVFSLILCVHDDISELCLIVCCMTALLCVIECRLSMWAAHLFSYLQLSWSRSFPSFWFSLLQVWGLVCVCYFDRARD